MSLQLCKVPVTWAGSHQTMAWVSPVGNLVGYSGRLPSQDNSCPWLAVLLHMCEWQLQGWEQWKPFLGLNTLFLRTVTEADHIFMGLNA